MNQSTSTNQSSERKRVAFHTLGCRLNFSESGSIAQGFVDRGYDIVEFGGLADVVFLNTCTVTDQADSTCRNLIRRAHASAPDAKIVVAGCYAQMEAPTIAKMEGVDLVLGTQEKYKVFDYLSEEENDLIHIDKANDFHPAVPGPSDYHTRAFLKIQDGCNYICSFCIIPFARGRSRANPISEVIKQARQLVDSGHREIVLTGVNIGEYENNTGEKLSDLVAQLNLVDGLERIRLSSVEPNTITEELIAVLASSNKFMDHFHLPLQSADPDILRSMRRKYTIEDYAHKLKMLKSAFPHASFGADIIMGYPGETEEQFANTFKFLRESHLTHFHVFPYSSRKGTTASKMENKIQKPLKKERVRAAIMLGEAKLQNFAEENIGRVVNVLFETRNERGRFEGFTTNFLRVEVEDSRQLRNAIFPVKLIRATQGKIFGKIIDELTETVESPLFV